VLPRRFASTSLDGKPLDPSRYAWDGMTLWLNATLSRSAELNLEFVDANK